MSVDVSLEAEGCCDAHSHNFSYNYTPLLREIGFPSWQMIDGLPAHIVNKMVNKALIDLANPHKWAEHSALIRGGGEWGTLNTLIESLTAFNRGLTKHPRAIVRTI